MKSQELIGVIGLEAKGIEANVTGEIIVLELLEDRVLARFLPSLKGTVNLQRTNQDSKILEEHRFDGANFVKVTNGRSNIFVAGLEKRVVLNGFWEREISE